MDGIFFYYGAERHSDGKTQPHISEVSIFDWQLSKENLPFMRERKERVRREFVLVK